MPDFWAGLIGAVIGTAGTLAASGIAYLAALKVEGDKSERNAISELMVAVYDFDAAILKLTDVLLHESSLQRYVRLATGARPRPAVGLA